MLDENKNKSVPNQEIRNEKNSKTRKIIVAEATVRIPGKKGKILRLKFGDIIEKPTKEQLDAAEKNKLLKIVEKPSK